jgi:hypothetical protein
VAAAAIGSAIFLAFPPGLVERPETRSRQSRDRAIALQRWLIPGRFVTTALALAELDLATAARAIEHAVHR